MMAAVEIAPWEELHQLEFEIYQLVPPIDPPTCHWLNSDAGPSFCRKHAWEARWKELPSFGPCPEEPDWFRRSEMEELMADGIDGGPGMGCTSDHPEHCATCGRTLEYLLTETGRGEELVHFADNPITEDTVIDGEQTYAIGRIFMNLTHPGADPEEVGAALKIARDAMAAIKSKN